MLSWLPGRYSFFTATRTIIPDCRFATSSQCIHTQLPVPFFISVLFSIFSFGTGYLSGHRFFVLLPVLCPDTDSLLRCRFMGSALLFVSTPAFRFVADSLPRHHFFALLPVFCLDTGSLLCCRFMGSALLFVSTPAVCFVADSLPHNHFFAQVPVLCPVTDSMLCCRFSVTALLTVSTPAVCLAADFFLVTDSALWYRFLVSALILCFCTDSLFRRDFSFRYRFRALLSTRKGTIRFRDLPVL